MKTSNAVRAGLAFGFAAIVGAAVAMAINSGSSPAPRSSVIGERLVLLDDAQRLVDNPRAVGLIGPVADYLGDAEVHRGVSHWGLDTYVAELKDGSLCIAAVSSVDGVLMTCGTPDMANAGQVTLRSQDTDQSPSYFIGLAANGIVAAEAGGASGVVEYNTFIIVSTPETGVYSLTTREGATSMIDMNITTAPTPPAEIATN